MNQRDSIQAIEDMKIPAFKVLEWANTVVEKYYHVYNEPDTQSHKYVREQFDRVLEASKELVDRIQQIQEKLGSDQANSTNISEIFIHALAGPIMEISGGTKIILIYPYWRPENEQTEDEQEHIQYIRKINSAAEYLSSLDRDVVLKIHLENLNR
jgi:hypothetical protein